jgi:phenylalanyl-tRNA synthetase beta chain
MKISLNWVFDHIKGELSRIDVAQLVSQFIKTTAEIEGWRKVSLNFDKFTIAEVTSITADGVVARSTEYNKDYVLAPRADAVVGACYLINHAEGETMWATAIHLGGTKDMVLPAIDVAADLRAGGWKSVVESNDYIVEVDNKSINSRPDLWGHRGIAREIAAILDLPLKQIDEFIVQKPVVEYKTSAQATKDMPFSLSIDASDVCKKFAALSIDSVTAKPSQLNMVIRLSRLDSRSIDLLVDATNYVMLDLGQPMHAFDAQALSQKNITVARARSKEKLLLLDGQTLELTPEDVVIADDGVAISLAGVMGGATTGITAKTRSVLLEAANFDAATIRRTAARHKKRSEASMRFEKNIDPNHNTDALGRFLFLLDCAGAVYHAGDTIVSLGQNAPPITITVEHAFIEARLGVTLKSAKIIALLEKLLFTVTEFTKDGMAAYSIVVPSFRATKDIKIPEDIVEEVGRYIGYDSLSRVMPALQLRPSDLHNTYCTRAIKRLLSYGLLMRELYGYSFFDESVLRELAWEPTDFIPIKNPVSENYTRLVTTLQPHMLKSVGENSIHHTQLRFYEWGRVWHMDGDNMIEQKSLTGIFFNQAVVGYDAIDFYAGKALLKRLFDELHIDVLWQSVETTEYSWLVPYQTAALMHGDVRIGIAGMVEQSIVNGLSPAGGAAFIFELNADYLLDYKKPVVRFAPLSKYPAVRRDVSMLITASATTDELTRLIQSVDPRIVSVTLIDFFTKAEWQNQKAMTFHVEMCDKEKTLAADDVDAIWNGVIAQLHNQGAVIR